MAVTINPYNKFGEYFGDSTIDLDGDTFKLALMGVAHTYTAANNAWADVSANEIASANGYTTPGQNLTSVTWVEAAGTVTWDAADVTWTASGGSIAASDGVIYDDTTTVPADALCFSVDFDGLQTAGDGTPFNVNWNASGIFTLAFV